MDKRQIGFIGFSILIIVGIVFVTEGVRTIYATAEDIDSISYTGDSLTFLYMSPTDFGNVGEGVTSSSVTTPNQTWLDFNYSNVDYINMTDVLASKTGSGYVIGMFIRTGNLTVRERLANINNLFTAYKDGNTSTMSFYGGNGTSLSASTVSASTTFGEWELFTVDYNLTTVILYKNGVSSSSRSFNSSSITFDTKLNYIGRGSSGAAPNPYNGDLGEVFIYNNTIYNSNIQKEFYNRSVFGSNLGNGIPIMMFHTVNLGEDEYDINYTMFNNMLNYLNSTGFQTVTIENYYNWTQGNYDMPNKPIILTFDDTGMSVLTNASKLMDNYGFVATFFVVTNSVGTGSRITWYNLTQLKNKGWYIASHTYNHTSLNSTTLSNESIIFQLNESRNQIYGNLSYYPIGMSCPGSKHDDNVDLYISDYYQISFCDYWSLPSIEYAHKSYPLIGTMLSRGNVINITTLEDFKRAVNINKDLLIYYRLKENNGTIAYDTSGNANNGTISGATWQTDGQTKTLTSGVDYSITDDDITLLNNDYLYSMLTLSYNYNGETSDGSRNATILRLGGLLIIISLLIAMVGWIKNNTEWIGGG